MFCFFRNWLFLEGHFKVPERDDSNVAHGDSRGVSSQSYILPTSIMGPGIRPILRDTGMLRWVRPSFPVC